MEKKISRPPNLKRIKARHLGPSHWLDEIPLRKTVCHNFSSGLIPLPKNTPVIWVKSGGFWAKHMGLKSGVIGNTLREHIANLETTWEHGKNTSATPKRKKKTSPLLSPEPKFKRLGPLSGGCTFPLAACNFYFQNC
jgi:hypothetical protein